MSKVKKRATVVEIKLRVRDVLNQLKLGHSRGQLVEYINKTYGLERAQADATIKAARDIFLEMSKTSFEEDAAFVINQYKEIILEARVEKDRHAAINALKEFCKLRGLELPKKLEVTNIDKTVKESDTATLLRIVKK